MADDGRSASQRVKGAGTTSQPPGPGGSPASQPGAADAGSRPPAAGTRPPSAGASGATPRPPAPAAGGGAAGAWPRSPSASDAVATRLAAGAYIPKPRPPSAVPSGARPVTAVVVTPTSAPHAVTSLAAGGSSALRVPGEAEPGMHGQTGLQPSAAGLHPQPVAANPWYAALRVPGDDMTSDLYTILRELEAQRPDAPRIGRSLRLAQDIVRLGQEPSLAFPAGAVASVQSQGPGTPWYVQVHSFGVLGPNGPMPLHFTEYVWQRLKHHADRTLVSFLNLFHHRMLSFFYRAWVDANPAVSADRPGLDRFRHYVASLLGVGTPALQQRDALGDSARRYYAGQFVDPVGNPEGLKALIEDHFGVPCAIEEFMGEWVDIPESCLWKIPDPALGPAATAGRLGLSTNLGSRVWLSQGKFRVVLGPLTRHQFNRVSPGGEALPALSAMVRGYVGDSLRWDLRLRLRPEAVPTLELGTSILGQTSWLWSTGAVPQDDLVFEPRAEPSASPTRRAAPASARA